jgi:enoyl-CoA hydratase/carnithine racemase
MDTAEVKYDVADRVATITLNRPERLNAWTQTMQRLLKQAMGRAADDSEVRAIVVTGEGRGFCAGADMSDLAQFGSLNRTYFAEIAFEDQQGQDFDQPMTYPLKIEKPVIAGINGPVAGVGLCFTLYCDIRFIAAGAKVTSAFSRRGLIAEYGSAWMLSRLIGPMNAADVLLSGRILTAEEAASFGLARLLPLEGFRQAVHEYAADLANSVSPRSSRIIKQQLRESWSQTLAHACVAADREMLASLESSDFQEGVAHFVERRQARFSGA